jgi:hypothetical protein
MAQCDSKLTPLDKGTVAMAEPTPLKSTARTEPDTAASRAARFADQARAAGAEAVHELIAALSLARSVAESVAALESVPAGQRELAQRIATISRTQIDGLQVLRSRNG